MGWKKWIVGLLACMATLAGHAQTAGWAGDATLAARLNGEPITLFALDSSLRLARLKDPKVTAASVLDAMVANRLMSAWARRTFTEDQLYASVRVGFARDVALDDQLMGNLRTLHGKDIEAVLHALPGGSLNGLITEKVPLVAGALDQVFGDRSALRLEFTLNAAQTSAAKGITLMRFGLRPGQADTITLYDVYRRQNVQGRMEFFNRNLEFIEQQVQTSLASRFVLDWARQKFGAPALADLRRTNSDRDDVRAAMALYGIGTDLEAASKIQTQLAKQVKPAEILTYYMAHKEQFTRIDRVKARHIRVSSEATGSEVVAALAKGGNFAQLARQYSSAPDRRSGGDLGWIVHSAEPTWIASLAFLQAEGIVSQPFRSAVGGKQTAQWEILLVEKRIEGYQEPDSETVRYIASGAIAQEKANKQFNAVRAQLLREARIEVNPAALVAARQLTGGS